MFQIEQSTFLHALGYAIGHSLWQMSALWLMYFGAIHLVKMNSSRKYILSVAASLTGLTAFIATFIYYANHLQINNMDDSALSMIKSVPAAVSNSENLTFIYNSVLATLRSLSPYLSCAYLVVMLVLSIRLANGFGQVKQLRNEGLSKPSIDWRLFVKEHASYLGIARPVTLFISNIASSPLTIGFWKPIILIPLASINQLSTQQMEAVLLHELAHIRRHDYLLNIILQVAEMALFFNPFMRLLLKQARQERENSCDDWVLQFRYNAAEYARALLAIEKQSKQSLLALGTNNKNEFQLLNRVKRMIAPERQSFNYRQQLGLLFLITILGLGFTVIVPRQKQVQKEKAVEITVQAATYTENNTVSSAPMVVDLVKNLENIQKVKEVVSSNEFKEDAKQVSEAAARLSEKMVTNSHINRELNSIELKANSVATALELLPKEIKGLDKENFKKLQLHLSEQGLDEHLLKIVKPALEGSVKAIAGMPFVYNYSWEGMEGLGQVWNRDADVEKEHKNLKERQLKIKKAQEEQMRQQRVYVSRMSKDLLKLTDSLALVEQDLKRKIQHYEVVMERAEKEAAIAPYRMREANSKAASTPSAEVSYNYNFSSTTPEWNEEKTEWHISKENAPRIARTIVRGKSDRTVGDDNCTCSPIKVDQRNKTVVVIDGKAIGERVKKLVQNVKEEFGDEWTEEVQQQVVLELKKDLKELEKLHIKTRIIAGSGNSKAILIQLDND